jgi:hypothetical protein
MTENNGSGQVKQWLFKTGLPLELEATAAFKAAGFGSEHSSIYVDPETQKQKGREIDFIAHTRDNTGLVQLYFVGECKSSNQPWVVFTNLEQYWHLTYFSLGVTTSDTRQAIEHTLITSSTVTPLLRATHVGGYAIRQAFSKDNDPAYAATIAALKAAYTLVNNENSVTKSLAFAMPIPVVDSPIFECSLDKDGEIQLNQVPASEFLFTAMIPQRTRACIRIVSRAVLPTFAAHCYRVAEAIKSELDYKVQEWFASIKART